jgi:multidrug efflux pump subunit AcrA (membrane-fusion protein)
MTMTVTLSEDDITTVKVGQPATVSISALSGVELGAVVSSISPVGTSSDGVVSYSSTITLTQSNPAVRPGMSATVSIITGQAQGVTVPNQAITGTGSIGTVDVLKNGKVTPTQVVVGLRGTERSVILSGLSAGEELQVTITLPALGTSTSSSSTSSGTLGGTTSGFGGRGFGGGGFGGGGGFFRGGGA